MITSTRKMRKNKGKGEGGEEKRVGKQGGGRKVNEGKTEEK